MNTVQLCQFKAINVTYVLEFLWYSIPPGPCGESMTFYRDPRKTFETVGFCDCDDVVEVKSDIPECEVIQRPLIYYPHNKRCYPVFSQGPCLYGMWLVLDENRNPTCTTNMCLGMPKTSHDDDASEGDYSLSFWFSKNEVCYRTLTKGYCDDGFILKVVKNNWRPECQRDIDADCIMTEEVNIPSLQCRPGNRLDSLKMCEIISNNDTNDATK
ncbi:unnamed protein product [Orchesella dallaii]|uniref:DUF4789 domain-containing protein n=1 Tax=Orchesella dallaii TaxID=48710 RepID=A0ABP1QA98_9HEXA